MSDSGTMLFRNYPFRLSHSGTILVRKSPLLELSFTGSTRNFPQETFFAGFLKRVESVKESSSKGELLKRVACKGKFQQRMVPENYGACKGKSQQRRVPENHGSCKGKFQ